MGGAADRRQGRAAWASWRLRASVRRRRRKARLRFPRWQAAISRACSLNAGGIVTDDVLHSLSLSRWLLGTQHVFVIQHTRCGLHGLAEKESQGADRKRWVRSSVRLRIFRRPRRERAAVGAHAARIPITG